MVPMVPRFVVPGQRMRYSEFSCRGAQMVPVTSKAAYKTLYQNT
nr:MAG TPA: hypothetical protein [Caudoviricetes sp.]